MARAEAKEASTANRLFLIEDSENVTITLTSIDTGDADITIGTANTATVSLADDDTAQVTIAATDSVAAESADHGQFTVTISNASDTDTVQITAGKTRQNITASDDGSNGVVLTEGTEATPYITLTGIEEIDLDLGEGNDGLAIEDLAATIIS